MQRSTLLIIFAVFALVGGAVFLTQSNSPGPSVSSESGTRIDAPGTRVESDSEKTRIQAPGVDITVPRDKNQE
jgi:hypothetical protein